MNTKEKEIMGAGNPQGGVTNGEKVVAIINQWRQVRPQGTNLDEDLDYTAQLICDALEIDPEGQWVDPSPDRGHRTGDWFNVEGRPDAGQYLDMRDGRV